MTAVAPYQPGQIVQQAPPEVTYIDPTGGRLVAWASAARAAHALAESLVKTSFAPKEFRGKPDEATAAIMLGDELGLSPISALRSVYVIHGTPSIYAKTMVALVQAHGHEVWTDGSTDSEVIVSGRRRGTDRVETSKWDIARARKAGYTSNAKYQTNPQEMLWAKAASEICKKIASDVLAGVPLTVEDLELEQPEPTAKVSRTRVQRQPPPAPPEPSFDAPDVSTPVSDSGPVQATAERVEPGISDAQLKAVNAGLTSLGIKDRETKLATVSQVIDREIGSSKDLTRAEASTVIEWIKAQESNAPAADFVEEPPADWKPEGDQ